MDQNQPTDNQQVDNQPTEDQVLDQATNNDLQKAIDDITNTTNVDPVFSDPVAAPSSVPEGDTGELSEPVGPFPEPKVEEPAPAPEPLSPIGAPDINIPEPAPAPMPESMSNLAAGSIAPAPELTSAFIPQPTPAVEPTPAPTVEPAPAAPANETLNMHQVKEAALRDLVPLLDHLNMGPTQKFDLYRNIFEQLKDYTVLDPAYRAASEIPDEKARAEALLYLVESIDKM